MLIGSLTLLVRRKNMPMIATNASWIGVTNSYKCQAVLEQISDLAEFDDEINSHKF